MKITGNPSDLHGYPTGKAGNPHVDRGHDHWRSSVKIAGKGAGNPSDLRKHQTGKGGQPLPATPCPCAL
jgi:hypothetical protein